jgi:hypothetical protein
MNHPSPADADTVELQGLNTSLTVKRLGPAVVLVTIWGSDAGELGDRPFQALDAQLTKGSFSLFIDARKTKGASVDVSNAWARWLRKHRDDLARIHMLTGSRYVQMTADFVRRFAELGDAMFLYTEATAFDEALARAIERR